MSENHNVTISAMLEDLQSQLRFATDMEERASLRLAIKHLRTTQDLLNPGSNLRRSRRKIVRQNEDSSVEVATNVKPVEHNPTTIPDTNEVDMPLKSVPTNNLLSDVTTVDFDVTSGRKWTSKEPGAREDKKSPAGVLNNSPAERKDEAHLSDDAVLICTFPKPDFQEDTTTQPSLPDSESSKRENRSRSPFHHLPHLKLRGTKHSSKEPEVKSPPPVTSSEDKGFSLGKRRFSKRFRKRASKQAVCESSESAPKPPVDSDCDNGLDLNSSKRTDSVVEDDLKPDLRLNLNSIPTSGAKVPDNPSVPNQIQSSPPEPLSPKKKNSEHQRRRSTHVIRRAIDRLFTSKPKHTSSGESSGKKTAAHEPHQPDSATSLEPVGYDNSSNQVPVNSASIQSKTSHPAPLSSIKSSPSTQPPVSEIKSKMAQVLQHPQEVAPTPNAMSFFTKSDDVKAEATVDIDQQRHLVLQNEIEDNEADVNLNKETLSESLRGKESDFAENGSPTFDEKPIKSPESNNATLNTTPSTNTSPPWAANQVKKSSFRSVSFVTPSVRPPNKEPTSAPPAFNKFTASKELNQPVLNSPLNTSDPSAEVGLAQANSRFGKREFSASFKTYRPTYKPPDHFKTRAESFRLHRPKDFIKKSANEEPPVRAPSSDRVVLNPVTPVSNRTSAPLTSTPRHKEPSPQSLNSSLGKPKPPSSLQRSESCKENQRNSLQEASPFIPIVRGNKRRSRGILSKILSSKIDSEKASLNTCNSPAELKSLPLPLESFESPTSPAPIQLHSVSEEKDSKQEETNQKVSLPSQSAEQHSVKVNPKQDLLEYRNLDEKQASDSFVEEVEKPFSDLKKNENQLEKDVPVIFSKTSDILTEKPISLEESVSSDITYILTSLIDQVVSIFTKNTLPKEERIVKTEIDKDSQSQREDLSSPTSPSSKSVQELSVTSSTYIVANEGELRESVQIEKKVDLRQTSDFINSVEKTDLVVEVVCDANKSVEHFSVSSLEDLPETSLIDDFQSSDSLSLSSDSCGSYLEDDEEMEGKYSLRSRRSGNTGSVRSRIQATENANGVPNKSADGKRGRQGVDVRALRNVEGVKSRMNKFSAMMTSPTSPTPTSPSKKDSFKRPDANNNINRGLSLPKSKIESPDQSKVNNIKTEEENMSKTNAVATNGYVEEPLPIKAQNAKNDELSVTPTNEILEAKSDSQTKVVEVEPITADQAPVECATRQSNVESTAPLVNGIDGRHLTLEDDKADTVDGVALESTTSKISEVAQTNKAATRQVVPQVSETDDVAKSTNDDVTAISPINNDPLPQSRSTEIRVSEEKSAPEAKPRRGRRRVSKSGDTQEAASKTASKNEVTKVKNLQVSGQNGGGAVEVTTRRRRRVRKSPDASKSSGSGSAASTPDREIGPLVPVPISDVDTFPSPTSPSVDKVPSSSAAEKRNDKTRQTTQDVGHVNVTSNDVTEKKGETEVGNKSEVLKLKRVHSAPSDEARTKAINTKEKNKEQTPDDAIDKKNAVPTTTETKVEAEKEIKKESIEAKIPEKMAPQTPTEVRYTMDNIDDCNNEAILQRMLSEATAYEERKRIRGVLRAVKKKQTESAEKTRISPSSLSPRIASPPRNERTLVNRTEVQATHTETIESRVTKEKLGETRAVSDKFSLRSTTLISSDMSAGNKKVGSIFDRDDDIPKKSVSRVNQTDKRREIVRNRSMPTSSSKDARRLFVAKLEGEGGGKSKKVGRSPTFVVPNANNVKQMLLKWCQSKTRGYEHVDINNFSGSWANGMAFCALVHNFFPDSFDFSVLDPKNREKNFELAFTTADTRAGVPVLLDIHDMAAVERPDWKCVYTYLSEFYKYIRELGMA